MKQRKSLDLNSKISLEALINEDGIELYFKVGKKEYRIANEEISQLRDWLQDELLTPRKMLNLDEADELSKQVNPYISGRHSTISGPTVIAPGTPIQNVPLEQRQAVTTSPINVQDLSRTSGIISPKDEMQLINLSSQIGKAKEAFSPARINEGSSGGI